MPEKRAWIKAVNRDGWIPNNYSIKCSENFVDGWHSKDPHHVNYHPTLFSYKDNIPSESSEARSERHTKRSLLQVYTNVVAIITHNMQRVDVWSKKRQGQCN